MLKYRVVWPLKSKWASTQSLDATEAIAFTKKKRANGLNAQIVEDRPMLISEMADPNEWISIEDVEALALAWITKRVWVRWGEFEEMDEFDKRLAEVDFNQKYPNKI